ncbi:MAG: exonuclease SbcCD subunit D [Pirellulales bacterium]
MPSWPICFVHASDFHLEQLPTGLADVPDHLVELLVESPYLAAERIFDAAIEQRADFVVLAGDVFDPQAAGPRGVLFLVEQFQKLRERGIAVYWCGGHSDLVDRGIAGVEWPDNVYLFPTDRAEEFICTQKDRQLARLLGRSNDRRTRLIGDDYPSERSPLFTVAVAHVGEGEVIQAHADVDYWALGGKHDSQTVPVPRGLGHYPGTPQGRSPTESGAHGCTVVQVEIDGHIRLVPHPTDVVRWLEERVELPEQSGLERLEMILSARLEHLRAECPQVALMVRWHIDANPRVLSQIRSGKQGQELLDRLRRKFGHESPAAWSVSLEAIGEVEVSPVWYEQENMLGDFLREVRRLQRDEESPLDLSGFLEESVVDPALSDLMQVSDPAARRRVLGHVATLGVDLLATEDSTS